MPNANALGNAVSDKKIFEVWALETPFSDGRTDARRTTLVMVIAHARLCSGELKCPLRHTQSFDLLQHRNCTFFQKRPKKCYELLNLKYENGNYSILKGNTWFLPMLGSCPTILYKNVIFNF